MELVRQQQPVLLVLLVLAANLSPPVQMVILIKTLAVLMAANRDVAMAFVIMVRLPELVRPTAAVFRERLRLCIVLLLPLAVFMLILRNYKLARLIFYFLRVLVLCLLNR